MSFIIGLSGMRAAQQDLSVIGNNIANANTIGFKKSRAEFADLYNRAFSSIYSGAGFAGKIGGGVRLASVSQQFSQGNFQLTGNALDFSIGGNGFFVLNDASTGDDVYTRSGAFTVDRDGNVVNSFGQQLQIFDVVDESVPTFNTGALTNLVLPPELNSPTATTSVTAQINLDASAPDLSAAAPFDPADENTYSFQTSMTVYDSLGEAHTATTYFRRSGAAPALDFETHLLVDGTEIGTAQTVSFDGTGALTSAQPVDFGGVFTPTNGAADIAVTFDLTGSTAFSESFAVNDLSQNGFPPGKLVTLEAGSDGVVAARYNNGRSVPLGQIALAKFANVQGLESLGNTNWGATFAAGDRILGGPGTSGLGTIESGGLEQSNVELSDELVNLITAQRNFQASAQVISAEDTVTQSILNI
ncbi:MAG: flagellar hook protein FlgE [bacterium]